MEGGCAFEASPFGRSTSEELLIRMLVEGVATPANTGIDGLGLSKLPEASRKNSEELFSSWIARAEIQGPTLPTPTKRTRQSSCRMSGELGVISQQVGVHQQWVNKSDCSPYYTASSFVGEKLAGQSRSSNEGAGMKPFNFNLTALHMNEHCQRMTRSRSSELRCRYTEMQVVSVPPTACALHRVATEGIRELNQAVASLGAFARGLASGGQVTPPTSEAQQSQFSSNPTPLGSSESVSMMVTMLKGSLEHKNLVQKKLHQPTQQITGGFSSPPEPDGQYLHAERHVQKGVENTVKVTISSGQSPISIITNSPSPSESSSGAPALSTGATLSDGPSISKEVANQGTRKQTVQGGGVAVDVPLKRKNIGAGNLSSPNSCGLAEVPFENSLKIQVSKTPIRPTRAGSLTSSGRSGLGLEISNPTKMRRVERREKMLEAKVRPVLPSDLQTVMKRCDALEKEVRSLKLTLSFMNRKDSEQTKQIEELEKGNQNLREERVQLLEELEHFTSR